jgi:CheY-like chemotaxis protein
MTTRDNTAEILAFLDGNASAVPESTGDQRSARHVFLYEWAKPTMFRCGAASTDIHMPQLTGPELVRWARVLRPEMRVLYMSANAADALCSGQLEPDAPILSKPFPTRSLRDRCAMC